MPQPSEGKISNSSFIELQSVGSTNNYAMAKVHEGLASHGSVYFAHEQTAGKGQRGKRWLTEKDTSITLSLVLNPFPLKPQEQFLLSCSVAVATLQFFKEYGGHEAKIKWPNDIFWRDRKAGGILIENVIQAGQSAISNWQWAIIGIGININQLAFPAELENPVSLKQITSEHYDVVGLAKELCASVDYYFNSLVQNGLHSLLEIYNDCLYKKGEVVRLKKKNRVFTATIKEISPSGQLIVEHGIEESFDFGEVEFVDGKRG